MGTKPRTSKIIQSRQLDHFHAATTYLSAKKGERSSASTKTSQNPSIISTDGESGLVGDLLSLQSTINEKDDQEEDYHEEGVLTYKDFVVPLDEADYSAFFKAISNTTDETKEPAITFEQFKTYQKLQEDLFRTRKVTPEDVIDTWSQVIGDDHPSPLTLPLTYEESLEVLSMLYDFHDIDKEFSFRESFEELIQSKENQKQLKLLGFSSLNDLKLSSIVVSEAPLKKKHVQYGLLSYQALLKWEELQEILADEVLSREEIDNLWQQTKAAKVFNPANPFRKSLHTTSDSKEEDKTTKKKESGKKRGAARISASDVIDIEEFLYLNRLIDEILDERELAEDEVSLRAQATDATPDYDDDEDEAEEDEDVSEYDEEEDEDEIDWDNLWKPSFDISPIYDEETIEELRNEYLSLCPAASSKDEGSKGTKKQKSKSSSALPFLNFEQLLGWRDVQEILQDKLLTENELKEVWEEALKHRSAFIKDEMKGKKVKGSEKPEPNSSAADTVNFDLFLRVNARIEYILADKEEEEEELTGEEKNSEKQIADSKDVKTKKQNEENESDYEDEIEDEANDSSSFYREQYSELTSVLKKPTLLFNDILEWNEVKELIDDGVLSEKQIKQLYDTLPKVGKNAGINVESFIMLNNMIDVLIDTKEEEKEDNSLRQVQGKSKSTTVAPVPAALNAKETDVYRMPSKDQELKPQFSKSSKGSTSSFFLDDEVQGNSINRNMLDEIEEKLKSSAVNDPTSSKKKQTELTDDDKGELSQEDYEMLQILDQADNLLNTGSFVSFDQLIGDTDDERLEAVKTLEKEKKNLQSIPGAVSKKTKKEEFVEEIVERILALGQRQERCGIELKKSYEQSKQPKETTTTTTDDQQNTQQQQQQQRQTFGDVNLKDYESVDREFNYLLQLLTDNSPKLGQSKTIQEILRLLNGKWNLLYTNSDMFYFYNGLSGFINILPGSKLMSLDMEFQSDGYLSETLITEKVMNTILPNKPIFPITITGNYEIVKEISFMTNELSILFRHYPKDVTVTKLKYQAEDYWKSLRGIALNEIIYIDNKTLIFRNAGALRIFFILQRKE